MFETSFLVEAYFYGTFGLCLIKMFAASLTYQSYSTECRAKGAKGNQVI